MKWIEKIRDKILHPVWKWVLPLAFLSFFLLFEVFAKQFQDTPIAYGVYVLSFFAVVVVTISVVQTAQKFWVKACSFPLIARYNNDVYFRVRVSLMSSFLINLCYAGLKVTSAMIFDSFWEGALGIYYILLCVVRFYLICKTTVGIGQEKQVRACRCAGWLMLVLDASLMLIAYQIVQDGQSYQYPGTLIYGVAAYAFYCVVSSIVQVIRYRKFRNPVLSAAKAVNLTCALVSLFSLENAMMYAFGEGDPYWDYMLPLTAAAMCMIVLGIAVSMIRNTKRISNK